MFSHHTVSPIWAWGLVLVEESYGKNAGEWVEKAERGKKEQ